MISKLPRWVEVGGFWLALLAGATNVIGLLGFKHEAISHLTGTSSLLGVAVTDRSLAEGAHLLGIILAFVLGAVAAGAIVGKVALRLGRRYNIALLVESLLLLAAMVALVNGSRTGHYLASAACGLQNGMVSTYSGAVVRTTHVTGMFTDLGTMFGARLQGHAIHPRQVLLYVTLISGFIVGSIIGAVLFARSGFYALAFPAAGAALSAAAYRLIRERGSDTNEGPTGP